MLAEKEKRKQLPSWRRVWLKRLAILVGIGFAGFLCLMMLTGHLLKTLYCDTCVKPSLDAEYIPTAEYLLANPMPVPQKYGVWYDENQVCVIETEDTDYRYYPREILINKHRVYIFGKSTYLTRPSTTPHCKSTSGLQAGLHLIEANIVEEKSGAEFYYAVAIEIKK